MASIRSRLARLMVRYVAKHKFGRICDSVQACRRQMKAAEKYSKPPKGTRVEPVEVGGVPGEWVVGPGASDEHAILYLHGGGGMMGSPANMRETVARISQVAGVRALSLDYRLAPEHPFPAALEDAVGAYQWLLDRGLSGADVVVGGESAGAGLAYQAIATLRNDGKPLPAGAFFMSPQIDFLRYNGESYVSRASVDPYMTREMAVKISSHYARETKADTSLLSFDGADLTGFPPLFIQVGDHELLLSDSVRLRDAARDAGVEVTLEVWDDMWHVFQSFASMIPEGRQAIERIGRFVATRLGS